MSHCARAHLVLRSYTILPNDSLEPTLEPLDRVGLVDLVGSANLALAPSALRDTLTWAGPASTIHQLTLAMVDLIKPESSALP